MILFYGMGGGFGHLTRIRAFIHTFLITAPYKVITANRSAQYFFTSEQLISIEADQDTTKNELAKKIAYAISGMAFDRVYIDTFPAGILGELTPELLKSRQIHCLARHMIWENYRHQIGDPIQFDQVYRFEILEPAHQKFIDDYSQQVVDTSITYPTSGASFSHPVFNSSEPLWLITHTTNTEELNILIEHAQDIATIEKVSPQLVVLSDVTISLSSPIIVLQDQNPMNWYGKVDRIFSAAGFNTWHQLKPWREKHVIVPFKRRFDDQFWRASQTITK